WSNQGEPEVAFGFADPLSGGWSELISVEPKGRSPAFVAPGTGGQFFVGVTVNAGIPDSNAAVPHVASVPTEAPPSYTGPIDLGCPIDPFHVDAVATDGGWLLARSTFENGCSGQAGKIQVTRFSNGKAQPGAELDSGAFYAPTLVARPSGAWLFYTT